MNTGKLLGELRAFVVSKPNDEETDAAMIAALSIVAATLIAIKTKSKTDVKHIKRVASVGVAAMVAASDGNARSFE